MQQTLYNDAYVRAQLEKFRNRRNNHFANHIRLARELTAEYGSPPPAKLLDLGCSIGTLALELALDGYETIGLDLDEKALKEGRKLATELGCRPEWVCADAGNFDLGEEVDTVVCFDLLEHLHDDVIGKMFGCVRKHLVERGVFIFHTFPTELDHVFYRGKWTCLPLIPFKSASPKVFSGLVSVYARLMDLFFLTRYGKTHKARIASTVHPNPLSEKRLMAFLEEARFEIVHFETVLDSINPLKRGQGELAKRYFSSQPVAQRSLFGVARPRVR